jgi:hypothetical protein
MVSCDGYAERMMRVSAPLRKGADSADDNFVAAAPPLRGRSLRSGDGQAWPAASPNDATANLLSADMSCRTYRRS